VEVLVQIAFLTALVASSVLFYRRNQPTPRTVLSVMILLMVSVPVLGPGYAPQYVYWYLPLLALYYHGAAKATRRTLIALYCIMGLTYLVEYALLGGHGQYLRHLADPEVVKSLARAVSSSGSQTLMRMPLFAAYLALLACVAAGLRSELRASPGPVPRADPPVRREEASMPSAGERP